MARLLFTFGGLAWMLAVSGNAATNAAPDWAWTLNVSGARGHAVAADASGNVYITGGFGGSVAFGTTNLTAHSRSELFIARVDPSGQVVWAAQATGSRDAYVTPEAIALDSSGGVYVAGKFFDEVDFGPTNLNSGYFTWYDAFLAKYDSAGRCQWAWQGNSRNNPAAYCSAVAVDSNNDVLISGHYRPSIFCSEAADGCRLNTFDAAFVAKFTAAGEVRWCRDIGGTSWNDAHALAVDEHCNVYVTGYFSREADFGTSRGVSDIYLAKYNSAGDFLWVRQAGSAGDGNDEDDSYDEGRGVAVDRTGSVYVTGSFDGRGEVTFGTTNLVEGGRAFFLAKYDSAGGLAWVRQGYGTVGTSIAVDGAGDLYTTVSPPFIHKYDAAGNLLWTKDAGPGQFTDSAIAVAPDGSLYVTTDNVFLRKLDSAGAGPRLSVAVSAQTVTLSWQLSAVQYNPRATRDLGAPDWRPLAGAVTTNGVLRTLTLPRPTASEYYRLQKN